MKLNNEAPKKSPAVAPTPTEIRMTKSNHKFLFDDILSSTFYELTHQVREPKDNVSPIASLWVVFYLPLESTFRPENRSRNK